ncbi:MAG TPA: hypothetical protein VHQ98_01825 [Gaiellaceae bacterium]|nr:hypothetical protein [Gaiellaceae bacterium]
MRFVPILIAAAALAVTGVARAGGLQTGALPAAEDVSLPFLCNWGYDWEERCYRDDLDRLELGGAGDKVWRSALRLVHQEEVSFGPAISFAELAAAATPQWVMWNLTDLVADWFSGGYANDGILLKLVDAQESYDVGGPAFPSSSYVDPAVTRLEVTYMP